MLKVKQLFRYLLYYKFITQSGKSAWTLIATIPILIVTEHSSSEIISIALDTNLKIRMENTHHSPVVAIGIC